MLDQVLKALDTEIARLKQARALLTGGGDSVKRKAWSSAEGHEEFCPNFQTQEENHER